MNIAFIPVRGGSKSIPLKNIKPLYGRPLVYWAVKSACKCKYIDKVYISTDSDLIRETVNDFKQGEIGIFDKAFVISRSVESASDTASTETAMLEFAENYQFDNIVLIQATSPLLHSNDLDRGFETFSDPLVDSVISVVRQKRFIWNQDESGFVHPENYDYYHRPRRQDFDGYLVENGAFYITSRVHLIDTKCRLSGNIKAIEMNEDSYYEIDEPSDWKIIETMMKKKVCFDYKGIHDIRILLTDCDGCLTDGGMYYSEKGDELKKFNTKDGMGFRLLKENDIITGIITNEAVELNRRRAEKLKVDIFEPDCRNKPLAVKKICDKYNIDLKNVCYIGDDINDVELLKLVGYGCAPANACKEALEVADYITKAKGGEGVIREIAELILQVRD